MEEFQGQEKKIIMISTVRSTSSYVKMDKDFNTGFLSNDKVDLYEEILSSQFHLFSSRCFTRLHVCAFRGSMWP